MEGWLVASLLAVVSGVTNAGLLPGTDHHAQYLVGSQFIVGADHSNPSVVVSIPDREDGRCGAWCAWREWSPCSQTKCGTTGHRTRTRDCACGCGHGGRPSHGPIDIEYECEGNSKEIETCVNYPCETIGEWCSWAAWSPCSAVRGGPGYGERSRSCNCPAPATGGASNCLGASNDIGRCTQGHIQVGLIGGRGVIYGGVQLIRDSIVFDGRSIVIDGTVYDGNHCVHEGYVYDGRFIDGSPIVYGYPVGHGFYNGLSVFSQTVVFDGSNIVIGGHSYAGSHAVVGGFEYDAFVVDQLPIVYGHSQSHRAKRHVFWEPYGFYDYPIYNSLYYDGSSIWFDGYAYSGSHVVHGGYVYDGYYVTGWDIPVVYGYLDGYNYYDGYSIFSDYTFYYDGYNFWHEGYSYTGSHFVYNGFAYDGYWMGGYPVIYGYPYIFGRKKRSISPVCGVPVCPAVTQSHTAVALVHHNGVVGGFCEWSDWSVCSKTECGTTGHQHRTRQCSCPTPSLGYAYCEGNDQETKTCVNEACPTAGAWCEWSPWSECSETCGPGHRDRTRTCGCPAPANGGEYCTGGLHKDQGQCKIKDCGLSGGWCPWTGWSACSVACGADGIRKRQRHCRCPIPLHPGTLHDCRGESEEKLDCHNHCEYALNHHSVLYQGHGHGLVIPTHLAYDGYRIIIDGNTYEGSSCTHGGYVYDGRFVGGRPILYGYPLGLYDGGRIFSNGVFFDGYNVIVGGRTYGAHDVSIDGFIYDGYLVDGLSVVYGHPAGGHGAALQHLHKRQTFHSIGNVALGNLAVETVNVGDGIVGQGIVYGNRQLVKSIVFNGNSIVIDGTVYEGTHCTHNGYVYDARYIGGFPTVFGYPVGYGVYNGYNVFSDNILFDGSSFVIGGRSFAGTHVVHSGFEYNGYLLNNLRVVYGFSTPFLSSFGVTGGGPHVTTGSHVELGHSPGVVTQANTYDQTQSHHSTHQSIDHVHNIDHEIAHHHKVDHHVDHLHHVDHDVHHKHLVDHDVHHKHIVDHDIEHAHTIAHEVSHHDHGTVDIGVVREVSEPTPPALSTPGLGYEFYVPSHFAYDGHQIVIDGTAYDGSHCTHAGYIYDGQFVNGNPLLSAYPVGYGIYDGRTVFTDGVNFNGQNLLIGGTSYGAHAVSHGGFLYDGYNVDGVNVVYGHPGDYFSTSRTVHHHHDVDLTVDHLKKVDHNVDHIHHVDVDVHHNVDHIHHVDV